MTKRRLKPWVKYLTVALFIIASIIIVNFVCDDLERIEKEAKNCDQANGHICSLYEVKNYMLRGN